jgi:uncharacterized membrane protein
LLALFVFNSAATAQESFEVENSNIEIYRDGLVHVKQTLVLDELSSRANLSLLSVSFENMVVLDENKLPVDYQANGKTLTIFSLGASKVDVEYDTVALTSKEAEVWTLFLESPYNLNLNFPKNSTVIYLSQTPKAIDTANNEITLTVNPGQWEIGYTLSLFTEEQTENTLLNAPFLPVEYLIVIVIAIVGIVLLILCLSRRKRGPNVSKTLNANPQLMKEDKDVIQFLAEKDGKAFEAEIRERFPNMPRTSLWRLIKRLEKMEIVEVKKIGLENQVQLKK